MPRPSPHVHLIVNITSGLDVPAVFRFVAQAYPEPLSTDYIWQRCNGTCEKLQRSGSVNISSDGLESNLTIFNVQQSDFGHYKLSVSNEVGNFSQQFLLLAQGKPYSCAANLQIDNNSLENRH